MAMEPHRIVDADLQEGLNRLLLALGSLRTPMASIGEAMLESSKARMLQGVSPDGTAFAPRSKTTIERYKANGQKYGPKPLALTNTMRQTLNYMATDDAMELGSNAIQAAVMQFGAQKGQFGARMGRTQPKQDGVKPRDYFFHMPWGDIPARPFLGVSEQDRTKVTDIIDEWMRTIATG